MSSIHSPPRNLQIAADLAVAADHDAAGPDAAAGANAAGAEYLLRYDKDRVYRSHRRKENLKQGQHIISDYLSQRK